MRNLDRNVVYNNAKSPSHHIVSSRDTFFLKLIEPDNLESNEYVHKFARILLYNMQHDISSKK